MRAPAPSVGAVPETDDRTHDRPHARLHALAIGARALTSDLTAEPLGAAVAQPPPGATGTTPGTAPGTAQGTTSGTTSGAVPGPVRRVGGAPAAPSAAPRLSAQALALAAVDYREAYGDPVVRAAAVPARRIRWTVPWRLAGAAGTVVLLVAGAVALRAVAVHPGEPVSLPEPAPSVAVSGSPTSSVPVGDGSPADAALVVHVVGQVAAPGIARLPAGSRVVDAVTAAGGALPEADLAALNMARLLVDGEQIVVPALGDQVSGGVAGAGAQAPGDGRVDLNTADVAALDALPGIGPVLAQRIVDHRATQPFASVDDLDDVSGIGPALLADLRDLVRV
ncbi:hypothetical protein CSO01_19430 [Cellulomonas soli]|uniref:Helix-hairpin-helix DNA-binding motif class 1 domain-containing protein n=1 Tax=Cellulomonas soli TaxID=931535 RepID=A0A512PDG2_9CELL|nr:hypothetical protein CSO01_19430 [Cellulomonas soli]